jgi:transcriptional regulator with XRE-family HTH domain
MPHRTNVLHVNPVEEQAAYRDAVAEILRNVQADYKATLLEISEAIGCTVVTISNAANKKNDLNAIYLKRLGEAFGCSALDPYARLAGGRMVAREAEPSGDVLPLITMATHKIALARSSNSPSGPIETLREQLGYLPDLRRLQREIGAEICRIEARRDAA